MAAGGATEILSHEALEKIFLRDAIKAVDDAVRTVRTTMEGHSFGVLSAIRQAENRNVWSDTYVATNGDADMISRSMDLCMECETPSPSTVFVSLAHAQ